MYVNSWYGNGKGLCLHNYINNKSVQFHFIAYSGAQMYVNMHFSSLMLLHVLYYVGLSRRTGMKKKIVRSEKKHNRKKRNWVKNSTAFYFIFNNLNSNTMALYASLKLYVILIKKIAFFFGRAAWWMFHDGVKQFVGFYCFTIQAYIDIYIFFYTLPAFPDKNHYHVIKVLSHFHPYKHSHQLHLYEC